LQLCGGVAALAGHLLPDQTRSVDDMDAPPMTRMHNPPHPGELLRDLWLAPMGLTITAAAARLNVTRKTVSEIVNGRAAVSPEMALRLELAFGKSAQSWLGHQADFDLWQLDARRADLGVQRVETGDHH
jgi:addiction module HigA family antidote